MTKKIYQSTLIAAAFLLFFSGLSGCGDGMKILFQKPKSDDKAITSFVFRAENNHFLPADAPGIIIGADIRVYVTSGTEVTALIPSIEFTGESISPGNGAVQDFSQTAIYTVTADDDTVSVYTVNVVNASRIVSVTSSTADGYYNAGKKINITVSFSSPVFIDGSLEIALNSGGTASIAGTGPSSSFYGEYTVSPGENAGALDVTDIILPGGAIADEFGVRAVLDMPEVTIRDSKTIIVDTTPPVIDAASGPTSSFILTAIFSEPVTGVILYSAFLYDNVSGDGAGSIIGIGDSDGSDRVITLNLNNALALTDNNTDLISATDVIKDMAGNSAGASPTAVSVGETLQQTLRPEAPGDETFTSSNHQYPATGEHWDKIDEEIPDGDTTYITNEWWSEGTWGARDLYNIQSPARAGSIVKITVYCEAKQNSQPGTIRISIKTGGTVYESSEKSITTEYLIYNEEWATNPNTSTAWTWDDIESLQAGVHLFKTTGYNARMTQIYVSVVYAP